MKPGRLGQSWVWECMVKGGADKPFIENFYPVVWRGKVIIELRNEKFIEVNR